MQLRYAFRLYPSAGQRAALAQAFGCARVVFNDALRAREDARAAGLPFPTAGELSKQLITEAKQTPERAWLGEVSAVVLQQSLRDLDTAYRNFFDGLKGKRTRRTGAPRFKSTQGQPAVDPLHRQRPLEDHAGREAAPAEDRRREGEVVPDPARRTPSTVTVVKDAAGRYFASLRRRDRARQRRCPMTDTPEVGIDLGLDPLRGPLRRHEDRQPAVPAPGGEEAEEGPAGPVPQAEGIQATGTRPGSRSPAHTRRWPTRAASSTTSSPRS